MNTESTASPTMTDEEYEALPAEERSRLRGDGGSGADPAAASTAAPGAAPASPPAADPAGTTEGADAQEEGKGGHGIPRARFNEVNERRREAEELAAAQAQELAELRARLAQQPAAGAGQGGARAPAPAQAPAQAPAFDVQEAEERYSQLLLEGDTKAAAAVRTEINQHIQEAAYQRLVQATTQQQAQNQIAGAVENLLQQHPWLDTDEGAEALELIEAAAEAKARRGMPFAKAIQEATAAIAPRFAPPDRVVQQGAASGDIRTQRANERGALHSAQQPPLPQAGMGNRATPVTVDTSKLSDEEYMALPEAERKKARGDY